MAKFKGKEFLDYLTKHPTLPISATALGISIGNLASNIKRREEAEKQNKKQVDAMNRLSESMSKVSISLDNAKKNGDVEIKEREEKPKKKRFRIGFYSDMTSDILRGTSLGAATGTFVNGVALAAAHTNKNGGWGVNKALKTMGYSLLIGASLGLVLGITKKIAEMSSRRGTNQRITNNVIYLLRNKGFEDNKDFTTDPKTADLEKTKVTVLINRGNGDLKLALNVISDEKLEKVCNRIVSSLPDKSKSVKKESNRYNEIMITTLSSGNDAIVISGIIEKFIRAGYPVYMIEVG